MEGLFTPKLSVITVVRNGEKFIEGCLRNVSEQQCKDAEHIVVDGASTDKTLAIIKQHAAKDPRIRFVSEPDRGQSDAMNKGLALARGVVVGFLNYDDLYEPGVLNRVAEIIPSLKEPALVFGNCKMLDNDDHFLTENCPADFNLTSLIERKIFPYNPSAYFYHKSLHNRVGSYPVHEQFNMDVYFLLRAAAVANLKYFNESWGIYRLHETSKTYVKNSTNETDQISERMINEYISQLSFRKRLFFRTIKLIRKMRDKFKIRQRIKRISEAV